MAARVVFRVTPHGDMWKVGRDGVHLADYATKQPAIDAARQGAHAEQADGGLAQVVVHRGDGTFETEWTYGEDPSPPKG